MKYKKFRIKNYKAIKDLTIELDNQNLLPIIGLNETGKSSILQAIFAFDCFNDKQYNGEFINYDYIKNKFENKQNPIIEAEIENINKNDLIENAIGYIITQKEDYFISNSRYKDESEFKKHKYLSFIRDKLLSFMENVFFDIKEDSLKIAREFSITQNGMYNNRYLISQLKIKEFNETISVNGYSIEELLFYISKEEIEQLIGKSVLKYLPHIIYIDDFKDTIPNRIKENDDWYLYIKEIFSRNKMNVNDFLNSTLSDKGTMLEDIKYELNENLADLWDKMHENRIKEEFKTVEIDLKYENEEFQFLINDLREKRENGKPRTVVFPVSMRSKGFQWFFNFFIKMKYNWKHINNEEYGSIILLDEPGVYLHTTFQTELIKILKELSKVNKIFYTTHLENMVNPKVIKINQIHIAKRKNEKVLLERITKIEDNKNLGEITPIINALKINNFPLLHFNEKVIITEGMTDKIFLEMLKEIDLLDKNIKVIPGTGVSNLSTLIGLFIGITENYTVIFDNDKAGREFFEKYKIEYGEIESKKWILHKSRDKKENIVLEDYYSDKMKEILLKYPNGIKTGLIELYYSENEENKKEFLEEIKKLYNNKQDIRVLINQIKSKLNHSY
jgi:uncharacterized protein MJECL43|nr:MAG TPA: putative ATP-dependent endonuclease [Caudoviricetes sp.]